MNLVLYTISRQCTVIEDDDWEPFLITGDEETAHEYVEEHNRSGDRLFEYRYRRIEVDSVEKQLTLL